MYSKTTMSTFFKVFAIVLVAMMVLNPIMLIAQDESTNACMQAE